MLEPLNAVCVADLSERQRQIDATLARGLPLWQPATAESDVPLAVVGSGPSVGDHLDEIRAFPGPVWAVNGAFGYLMSVGVTPTAFVSCDPLPAIADYVWPVERVAYLLASVCHSAVFDKLDGARVEVWHCAAGNDFPSGSVVIGGGPFTSHRAVSLGYAAGHRKIHLWGVDSSYRETEYVYGAAQPSDAVGDKTITVACGGRLFKTSPILIHQASFFAKLDSEYPGLIEVHGDGLTKHLLAQPNVTIGGDYGAV